MIKRIYTGRYYVLRKQVRKAREKYYYTKYEGMGTEKECDDAYAVWTQLRRDLKEAVIFEDFPEPNSEKDLLASLIRDVEKLRIRFSLWQHTETGIYYLQVHGWSPNSKRPEKDGLGPGPAQKSDAERQKNCYIKILERDIPAGYCAKSLAQCPKSVFSLGPLLRREVLAALQASAQAWNENSFKKD